MSRVKPGFAAYTTLPVNREIVEFPSSTATMDTVQFSTYCEKLREYGREFLGIEIPDPDKYWRTNDTGS